MAVFNLVHISDLHFGKIANRSVVGNVVAGMDVARYRQFFATHNSVIADAALECLSQIHQLMRRRGETIDLIVVSGDVGTTGRMRDLIPGRSFLEKITQETQAPVFVMPGNHDRFMNNFGSPDGANFEIAFPDDWRATRDGRRFFRACSLWKRSEALAVIAADFSLAMRWDATGLGILSALGQGMATQTLIDKLIDYTEKVRGVSNNVCPIWVIHFPPVRGIEKALVLRNSNLVRAAARAQNIRLILCGHIHQTRRFRLRHGGEIWCTGSACQYAEPAGHSMHLVELMTSGADLVQAVRHEWRYREVRFGYDVIPQILNPKHADRG